MDHKMYDEFAKTQNKHWWFVGRRNILLGLLDHTHLEPGKVLDIGCGMGAMLNALEKYGTVYGTDFEDVAVDYCRGFFGADKIMQGSLPNHIPYEEDTFSLVTCLDVIEHIDEDAQSLNEIYNLLKPGGVAVLTVPALACMWGYNDILSHHKRRYTKKSLIKVIGKTPFEIERCSYFNFLLLPEAYLVRRLKMIFKIEKPDLEVAVKDTIMNTLLTKIFTFEKILLTTINLPVGVSLVVILRKNK